MKALKNKLKSREVVFASTCSDVAWSGILPRFKNEVLDLLILDAEHGRLDLESCEELIRTCRYLELPVIVRALDTQYHLMSKYLDFGADGILVPRVETVEQAMAAVSYLRFPPVGKKGCGGSGLLRKGETVEDFNRNRLIFLQIESPQGAAALEDMLKAGAGEFAGVIVGPTDLSIAMGLSFRFDHPDFIAQVKEIFGICRRHGVSCGIFCENDQQMQDWHDQGANILWSGTDLGLFSRGYNALCDAVRSIKQGL